MLTASDLKLREPPERVYWIYALVDPRNNEVRYIGQSLEVHSRGQYHRRSTEQPVKGLWIQELQAVGLVPQVMLFESANTREIANQAETYWINYCRERGANLLNGLMLDWRNPANIQPVQHLNR